RDLQQRNDEQQNKLFDLIIKQQASSKYALLLGFCFMLGIDTLKDEGEALKYWENNNDPYGKYMAGLCYYTGSGGVVVNDEKAFSYFQISANAGNSCGKNALGNCYRKGHGCNKNFGTAHALYQESAEAGNAGAQCNLGFCYEYGKEVETDLGKA